MNRSDNWVILLLLFSLNSLITFAQPTPDAQCTFVDNDSITISWKVDNTDFQAYWIYKSYDQSNFLLVDLINNNTDTTYTYSDTISIPSIIYYRLYTIKDGERSDPSNIISIILLDVNPIQNKSIAQLAWNQMEESPNGYYSIYRQASGQADWQFISSTQDQIYMDTISSPFCSDTLMRYRIEYTDPSVSCISRSTTDSATLADNIYPGWLSNDIVQLDTVSVDFQGNVSISWEAYPAIDIQWYYIYRSDMNQSGWYVIDSVPGHQLDYIDSLSTADLESVAYRVAAKDTCHAPGPGGFAKPFSTIFLKPISWNYCDTAAFLQWDSTRWMNPYPGLFSIYDIDPSSFEYRLVGETTDTNFIYQTGFKPDTTYCFFIRANNSAGKSSTSCIQCFDVVRPEQPDTLHLQLASVDTNFNDRINISVFVDIIPSYTKCSLLRKVNNGDPYDTLLTIPVSKDDILFFTDTTAQVGLTPYYYKTVILDGCDNTSWLPVNEVRTVHLMGSAYDQINHLFWNRYQSTVSRVTGYRLYRKIDGLVDTIIDVGTDTVYDDPVYNQEQISGRFSYLVEARILPFYREVGDTLAGFSNEILLVQLSRINMPNAFTPNSDGMNDLFLPRNIFTEDQAEFLFIIYNRWGQKVYESTSIHDAGWDGTFNDFPSPAGVYVFFIRYVSFEGEIFEEKGPFTLLR